MERETAAESVITRNWRRTIRCRESWCQVSEESVRSPVGNGSDSGLDPFATANGTDERCNHGLELISRRAQPMRKLRGAHDVFHQRCNRDWPDPARHRCDERCDFLDALEIDIAVQLAISANPRSHIDHHRAGLHQIGGDLILLAADRSHNDICRAHEAIVIFFARVTMAPDRGGVAHSATKHVMNRLRGDVIATDDYGDASFGFDSVKIQHAPDCKRSRRQMKRAGLFRTIEYRNREARDAIHVLLAFDCVEYVELVEAILRFFNMAREG